MSAEVASEIYWVKSQHVAVVVGPMAGWPMCAIVELRDIDHIINPHITSNFNPILFQNNLVSHKTSKKSVENFYDYGG